MADKQIGFVRVEQDDYDWLKSIAADGGLTMVETARAIISQARRNGWTVSRSEPYRVIQPAPPPAADRFGRQS